MMKIIICLLLCLITSCTNVKKPSLAVQKNNQAVELANRNMTNPDSLNKVIDLLDEAIAIDPAYKLAYGNKVVYLSRLGKKEQALTTILQLEKLCVRDPYCLLGKGMILEQNDEKQLASEAYKEATSLLEKRLNEKPVEPDFLQYRLALYLRDDKRYSLEEVERKYPNVLKPETRRYLEEVMKIPTNESREEYIFQLVSGWNEKI